MILSRIYHYILIAILPIAALVLYMEGQNYDPALIQFKSGDVAGDDTILAFFPREIDGFSQAGQVRTYGKENLYEYVNGHAEYFLSAGFLRLSVGEYVHTGEEPAQPDAVIEIYDMGKSIHAFGVLADEAGNNSIDNTIGMMGFRTAQGVSFFSGTYYIKINTFNDTVPVDVFVHAIENQINVKKDSFPLFARFPDIGRVITTRFIKEAYRGLDFLQNVLEREYVLDGKTIQVFLISDEKEKVQRLVASFFNFFDQSDVKHTMLEKNGNTYYKVLDPYEGDWFLIPLDDVLFGIYGPVDESMVLHFVQD